MSDKIEGYIKLINSVNNGNNYLYNFFLESNNGEFYKISVSYKKYKTGDVKDIKSDMEEININDINTNGKFFIPKNIEDATINVDEIEGKITPKGCEIGPFLEFNKNFVMAFKEQMMPITEERIFDIMNLNKDNFTELVDEVRDINLLSVNIDDDPYEQYVNVPVPETEKFDTVREPVNRFGNYISAYEKWDDR